MRQYRKYDWPALFVEFEQSGLNQTQFCKEKAINPKYFCQKHNEAKGKNKTPFTKVEAQSPSSEGLTLEVGRCRIICPNSMPLHSLAALIHTLA